MPDPFYAGGGIGLGPAPVTMSDVQAYPAPLVTSRDRMPGPAKTAVRSMDCLARAHGWSVFTTYAKGWIPNARTGAPSSEPRESLALRMCRGGQRAVAVYRDHGSAWSWDTLYLWSIGEHPSQIDQVGRFLDAITGAMHGTARWHPPWIHPGTISFVPQD